jgi:hypothetical protein
VDRFYRTLSAGFALLLKTLEGRRVAVVGHARPDGDCIGSQVALARVLAARGVDVICVNGDAVPRRLQFLTEGMKFFRVRRSRGCARRPRGDLCGLRRSGAGGRAAAGALRGAGGGDRPPSFERRLRGD